MTDKEQIEQLTKDRDEALKNDWTGCLIDRLNELVRENRSEFEEVQSGPKAADLIGRIHGAYNRLKQERDEARAALRDIKSETHMPDGRRLSECIKEVIEERDELRRKLDGEPINQDLVKETHELSRFANQCLKERDAAQEEAAKWKAGCATNADCYRDAVRKVDEQRLRILDLEKACAEIRGALGQSWTDIQHWLQLAINHRKSLGERANFEPYCPSMAGIDESERVIKVVSHALSSDCGRGMINVRELERWVRQRLAGVLPDKQLQEFVNHAVTDDEIRIAIAEACPAIAEIDKDNGGVFWKKPDPFVQFDPLNDLNAMHEAEKILDDDQHGDFEAFLQDAANRHVTEEMNEAGWDYQWGTVHATARQRAEAFLRTLGKWKE